MIPLLRLLELARYYLGYAGLAGLGLSLLGLVLMLFFVLPQRHQAEVMTRQYAQLQIPVVEKTVETKPVLTQPESLEHFYQQFPAEQELPALLEKIHRLAHQQNIVLEVGEYKLSNDPNKRLKRYEIIFPVNAKYTQLRSFIHQAHQQFPTLGLNEVNIKRENIGDNIGQIKLNFALLMRRAK